MADIDQLHSVSLNDEDIIEQKRETNTVDFQTKMEYLKHRFYFHELIKQTSSSNHYIVEDLDLPQAYDQQDSFFYLKQIIFNNKEEFDYCKNYYQKLLSYCKTPYAKNDTVHLLNVFDLEIEVINYYEIVVQMTYGEADRIDFTRVQKSHIYNFLKSICLLLQDLKKLQSIYHGNVYLRNIVLDNNQHLKLSGFKPIYIHKMEDCWQKQIIKEYGFYRFDVFLIGLLWIVFMGIDLSIIQNKQLSLAKLLEHLKILKNNENLPQILMKFIDLEKYQYYQLEQAILEFEEDQLLQNIDKENEENQDNDNNPFIDQISQQSFSKQENQSNAFTLTPNLFKRNVRDSDINNNSEINQPYAQNYDNNQFYLDQEFTLQCDMSQKDFTNEPEICIDDKGKLNLKKQTSPNLKMLNKDDLNRRSTEPANFKKLSKISKNTSSEKQFFQDQQEGEQRFSFFGNKNFESNPNKIIEENESLEESVEKLQNNNSHEDDNEQNLHQSIEEQQKANQQSLEEFIVEKKYTTRDKKESVTEVKNLFNFKRKETLPKKEEGQIKINVSNIDPLDYQSNNSIQESEKIQQNPKQNQPRDSLPYQFVFKDDNDQSQNPNKKNGSEKENKIEKKQNKNRSKSPKKQNKSKSKLKKKIQTSSKVISQNQQKTQNRRDTAQEFQNLQSKFEKMQRPIQIQQDSFKKKENSQKKNDSRVRVDTHHIMENVHRIKMPKTAEKSQSKTGSMKIKNKTANKKVSQKEEFKKQKERQSTQELKKTKKIQHNYRVPLKAQACKTNKDKVQKLIKKALKPVDFKSRNDIFTFNNNHKVKNISYQQVLNQTKLKKSSETLPKQEDQIEEKEQQIENQICHQKDDQNLNNTSKLNLTQTVKNQDVVKLQYDQSQIQDNVENDNIQEKDLDYIFEAVLKYQNKNNLNIEQIDFKKMKEATEQINNKKKRKSTKKVPDTIKRSTKGGRKPGNILDMKPNEIEDLQNTEKKQKKLQMLQSHNENVKKWEKFMTNEKYEDANKFLEKIIIHSEGINRLDMYSTLSFMSYYKGEIDLCEYFLQQAISYLDKSDIYPKNKEKRDLLQILTIFYYKNDKYEKVLDVLANEYYQQQSILPIHYYLFKGDSFQKLKNFQNAQDCYGYKIQQLLNNEFDQSEQQFTINQDLQIKQFFQLLKRYFTVILKQNKDPEIIESYNNIKKHFQVQTQMSQLIDFHKYNFAEFQLDLLELVNLKNPTLQNYFLNDQIQNTPIDIEKMDEKDIKRLIDYYYEFAMFLRNKDNFLKYKQYYIMYIEEALRINKCLKSNEENLKQRFLILVKRGLYQVEQKIFDQAQISFDFAIKVYSNLYDESFSELIDIFFKISNSLIEVENYKESRYYLERIISKQNQSLHHTQDQAMKNLIEVLYLLNDYVECRKLCKKYLIQNTDSVCVQHREDYFKILCFYRICCKNQTNKYDKFLQQLKTKFKKSQKKTIEYFTFFYNSNFVNFSHSQITELRVVFDDLQKIMNNQNKYYESYLNQMAYFYSQNVLGIKKKTQDNLKNVIEYINTSEEIREIKVAHVLNIFKLIFFYAYHQIALMLKIDLKKKQRRLILITISNIEQNNKLRKHVNDSFYSLEHQYD